MNDARSFKLGWACFGIAGCTGAYLGWRENNVNQIQRRVDDVEDTRKRNESLKQLEKKWKIEGLPASSKTIAARNAAKEFRLTQSKEDSVATDHIRDTNKDNRDQGEKI